MASKGKYMGRSKEFYIQSLVNLMSFSMKNLEEARKRNNDWTKGFWEGHIKAYKDAIEFGLSRLPGKSWLPCVFYPDAWRLMDALKIYKGIVPEED